jgi:hypothetical protein
MQEVQIFAKGRFLAKERQRNRDPLLAEPRYYQIFWGFVTSVSVSEGVPEQTISLNCEGMLKWWKISKVALNPAAGEPYVNPTLQMTERHSVFFDLNPYQIIFALAVNFGNIFQTTNLTGWTNLLESLNTNEGGLRTAQQAVQDLEEQARRYWANRFASLVGALRMYGLTETQPIDIDTVIQEFKKKFSLSADDGTAIGTIQDIYNRVKKVASLEIDFDAINLFRPQEGFGQIDGFQSRYADKYTIAREVADGMQYEFYQDMNGEIVFKPPFWNLDVRGNDPISIFEDYDIYDRQMSFNEDQIVTRVDVTGSLYNLFNNSQTRVPPAGWAVDYKLLKHYGFRPQHLQVNWIRDSITAHIYAAGWLNKVNAFARTMTMNTTFRPEVRLGYPIYIPSIDTFAYVEGVNHQFSFGQQARTSLQLTAVRRKYIPSVTGTEEDNAAYKEATEIEPDTGHIVGGRNYAMVFQGSIRTQTAVLSREVRPGEITSVDMLPYANQTLSTERSTPEQRDAYVSAFLESLRQQIGLEQREQGEVEERNVPNNQIEILPHLMGLYSGLWVERKLDDVQRFKRRDVEYFAGSPQQSLFQGAGFVNGFDPSLFMISDGKGYELIGAIFPYGRNLYLASSGLVTTESGSVDVDPNNLKIFAENSSLPTDDPDPVGNILSERARAFFKAQKRNIATLERDSTTPLGYTLSKSLSGGRDPTKAGEEDGSADTECSECSSPDLAKVLNYEKIRFGPVVARFQQEVAERRGQREDDLREQREDLREQREDLREQREANAARLEALREEIGE